MDKATNLYIYAIALLAAIELIRRYRLKDIFGFFYSEDMPKSLEDAEVVLSEQDIYTRYPVPMHGRVDQLYETVNGFVLVDTKRSYQFREVTESDIIQLSVYRTILLNKGYAVSREAYIRNVTNGRRIRYISIELYSSKYVVDLYQKYMKISKSK